MILDLSGRGSYACKYAGAILWRGEFGPEHLLALAGMILSFGVILDLRLNLYHKHQFQLPMICRDMIYCRAEGGSAGREAAANFAFTSLSIFKSCCDGIYC